MRPDIARDRRTNSLSSSSSGDRSRHRRPVLHEAKGNDGASIVHAMHADPGEYWLACGGAPPLLFTENESNAERLWGAPNRTSYVKDGIDEANVHARRAP